eukprot:scaffold115223_cov38-Phaeocystis_antarctica.AAC.2
MLVGVLVTVLVQSSSTSTSIFITMVAAELLTVKQLTVKQKSDLRPCHISPLPRTRLSPILGDPSHHGRQHRDLRHEHHRRPRTVWQPQRVPPRLRRSNGAPSA